MTPKDFQESCDLQLDTCRKVLFNKAKEYTVAGDRLHNFKIAAELEGCTSVQALGGMMAKHIISLYDLIREDSELVRTEWSEKITDSINYLLLLNALIADEQENKKFIAYYADGETEPIEKAAVNCSAFNPECRWHVEKSPSLKGLFYGKEKPVVLGEREHQSPY